MYGTVLSLPAVLAHPGVGQDLRGLDPPGRVLSKHPLYKVLALLRLSPIWPT